jgi:hypothetical protein
VTPGAEPGVHSRSCICARARTAGMILGRGKDRTSSSFVLEPMKLAHHVAPIAVTLFSGFACTPSSNRGVAAGTPNDSASDPSQQASSDVDDQRASNADSPPIAQTPPMPDVPPARAFSPIRQRPVVVPSPAGQYRVRIVDASMHDLRMFHHDGRSYVLGTVGERYAIVVSNPTPRRVEAVISVDGLDAIDGTAADYVHKRGYILPAYGNATIEGFRTSLDQVATFRFSSVADSYAGRLGQARDVGVIGVAFFPERAPIAVAPPPSLPRVSPYNDWEGRSRAGGGAPHATSAAPARKEAPSPSAPASGSGDATEESSNGTLAGRDRAAERKGLGTEFGEARESHVGETLFTRANASSPSEVAAFRYNDRAGLMALGIRVDPPFVADSELRTRETADPFRANRFAAPPP